LVRKSGLVVCRNWFSGSLKVVSIKWLS